MDVISFRAMDMGETKGGYCWTKEIHSERVELLFIDPCAITLRESLQVESLLDQALAMLLHHSARVSAKPNR